MNITSTEFDYNYYYSEKAGNQLHGFYPRHNVDVFNEIIIGEERFSVVYQTGMNYLYGDYQCPDPDLAISEDGGSHALIVLLDELYETDFQDSTCSEYIAEKVTEAQQHCASIKTADDLLALYLYLRNESPQVSQFVDMPDDLESYEDDSGRLTLAVEKHKEAS